MMLILFGMLINVASSSIRGPHHPRSSISHHHYIPQGQIKLTQDEKLLHDTIHLQEDLGSIADKLDVLNMSKQELEFHYFKLHDIDNNTKLDGLEILHAVQHTFHDPDEENVINKQIHKKTVKDDLFWIVEFIDKVLEEDDLDNDGFLGYIEFVHSRERDANDLNKNICKTPDRDGVCGNAKDDSSKCTKFCARGN